MTKPLIPNNFKINDNLIINLRLDYFENIEEYELNDKSFMYLIMSYNPDDDKIKKLALEEFVYSGKTYWVLFSSKRIKLQELYHKVMNKYGFSSVAGMENIKTQLFEEVIDPFMNPEKYERFKISTLNGILLYGPTGCGKTYIVKKLAEEMSVNFIEIKHSDIASSYVHGTVGKINDLFKQAKRKAPCILFIDEIEGLLPSRDNISTSSEHKHEEINEFLPHLNKASEYKIIVIGATNAPHLMDKAVLRSGRFDKKILIPAPDFHARAALFEIYLEGRPFDNSVDINELSEITNGYSCSDIELIVNEAARKCVTMNNEQISREILLEIIKVTSSSLTSEFDEKWI